MTDRKAYVLVLIREYAENEEASLFDDKWLMKFECPIFTL